MSVKVLLPLSILHWPKIYPNNMGEFVVAGRHETPLGRNLARLIMFPLLVFILTLPVSYSLMIDYFYRFLAWMDNRGIGTYRVYQFEDSTNPLVYVLGYVYRGLFDAGWYIVPLYYDYGLWSWCLWVLHAGFIWMTILSFCKTPQSFDDARIFYFHRNILNYLSYPLSRFVFSKKTTVTFSPEAIVTRGLFGRKRVFRRDRTDSIQFTNFGEDGRTVYMNIGLKTIKVSRFFTNTDAILMLVAFDYANSLSLDPDNNEIHLTKAKHSLEKYRADLQPDSRNVIPMG